MESRLIVDLSTGHLEVSGSEELVKHIFNEFRADIASRNVRKASPVVADEVDSKVNRDTTTKKNGPRKTSATSEVNKDLDTLGVEEFFDTFEPKTDAERAMIFVKFLHEKKGMSNCAIRDIYTCFFAMKDRLKLPSMTSLLNNDRGRTKYFTQNDGVIELTKIGENYFSQKLRKKSSTS